MIFLFVVLGWLLCGLVAVFLEGIVERILRQSSDYLPITFLLGPLALIPISMFIFSFLFVESLDKFNFVLEKIYRLGRGK